MLYKVLIQRCVMFTTESESFRAVSEWGNMTLSGQKLTRCVSVLVDSQYEALVQLSPEKMRVGQVEDQKLFHLFNSST